MAELVMPILGADMEAATLVSWLKHPGDVVGRGDIVAEVETEKGLVEIETFVSGTIERLLVEPGTKVPVGTVLAIIRGAGEPETAAPVRKAATPETAAPAREAVAPTREEAAPAGQTAPAPPPVPGAPAGAASGRVRVSPAARRRAQELGVDVDSVTGSGAGGVVTLDDVERARHAPPQTAAPGPTPMRQAIAAAMTRAKREIPHFYLTTTIPLRPALDWLARENVSRGVTERLLPGALFVKAVALALRDHRELNARVEGGAAAPADGIHVGVAISLRKGGLVAPAIHDTDTLALPELMARLRDVVARARTGKLRGSELSEGTITVTSLGDLGVETVIGVIFPPQVAIVGFGRVVERPWVEDGRVVAAPVVTASISADHRITDGHRAARFLGTVDRLLQTPEAL